MNRDTSQNPDPADVDTAEIPVITPPFGTRSVFDAPNASLASTPLAPRRSFVSRRPLVTTAIAALWIGSLAAGLWFGRAESDDAPEATATEPNTAPTTAPPSTSPPPPAEETTTTTQAPPPTYYEDNAAYGTDFSGQHEEAPPPETVPPPTSPPSTTPPPTSPPPTTTPQPPPTTPTTVPSDFNESTL